MYERERGVVKETHSIVFRSVSLGIGSASSVRFASPEHSLVDQQYMSMQVCRSLKSITKQCSSKIAWSNRYLARRKPTPLRNSITHGHCYPFSTSTFHDTAVAMPPGPALDYGPQKRQGSAVARPSSRYTHYTTPVSEEQYSSPAHLADPNH